MKKYFLILEHERNLSEQDLRCLVTGLDDSANCGELTKVATVSLVRFPISTLTNYVHVHANQNPTPIPSTLIWTGNTLHPDLTVNTSLTPESTRDLLHAFFQALEDQLISGATQTIRFAVDVEQDLK